ncbi:helicase protein [Oesophagostomum dentatum]|uniref:Helicase protein n=1 Tax=Oesophagostomum dentatum TaxID=61180 RepID=A0A0B1T906_OESDE|nr:helicase protein [Oesophagostomum dentatum]
MDDLLSVALSESGLDEFLTPAPSSSNSVAPSEADTPSSSGISPAPSVSSPLASVEAASVSQSTSPQDTRAEEAPQLEAISQPVDLADDHVAASSPSTSTMQEVVTTSPGVRVVRKLSTPCNVVYRQSGTLGTPIRATKQVRIAYPAESGSPQLLKQTIHTPDGPRTQVLRPFINEHGQTVYRAVRTIPAPVRGVSVRGRTIIRNGSSGMTTNTYQESPSSETIKEPQRVIVFRQNTPTGTVLIRKSVPPGTSLPRTLNVTTSDGVVRRFVTREAVARPIGSADTLSRGTAPSARGHTQYRTSGQYFPVTSSSTSLSSPSTRGGSVMSRSIRGAPAYGTAPGTRLARYAAVPVRKPLNHSASSPSLRSLPSYSQHSQSSNARIPEDSDEMAEVLFEPDDVPARSYTGYTQQVYSPQRRPLRPGEMVRRTHPALVGSASSTLLRHRTVGQPVRGLPAAGAEVAASVGAFEQLDVSVPAPTGPPPKLYTKSQKAKDEMRLAHQTAAEKRSEIDEDEENLGYAETYADYVPAKLRSGVAHPDSVVETASLSSVAPPDVKYQISIPEYVLLVVSSGIFRRLSFPLQLIDSGSISALQLEAVIYACQMHQQRLPSGERTGYLIGDGAGVGKGRTVAAIIFENYLLGRKRSIWLSVSSDLKFDAERDLRDIGAGNIKVYALNKLKYAKISGKENGSIKKGVIFATYSSLIGECRGARAKYRSRLKQLIQWFGVDYDGVIILDECHRAKNLVPTTGAKPTKTGRMVLELQKALPNARVVYASATGATEPRNMAYMTRLGLWGPGQAFPEFTNFINAVERRGVGAMEIVAMDMKQRGLYLARQLSFRGVSFTVREVPLSDEFVKVYDDSVKLWLECRRQFQNVLSAMTGEERSSCKQLWGQFWASHQRFFKYLCIAAKVDACVQMARDAIKANKCVVIGLQSTGEARTLETLEEMGGELTEFVSTAKAVLQSLIERHFPVDVGSIDIYRDFDIGLDDFEKKRRKMYRGSDYDFMEQLGFGSSSSLSRGSPTEPRAKRPRPDEDQNSTTSSSSDEDYGDLDVDSGLEDDVDGSEADSNLEDGDEWLKALLAEAESSSESDEDPTEGNQQDNGSGNENAGNDQKGSAGEEEFNPFNCDFTDDPWASKQQVVEDSPRKQNQTKSNEELEELRQRRRARRKRRKKRMRKMAREAELKKRRDFESDAMKNTATQFISSSRLIDPVSSECINPKMIKAELLSAVERLGPSLPPNTLDLLIDQLGGPEFVAEMTGRKGRIVTREDGEVEYELRHAGADVPLELMNMDEKDKFMKGEKKIAIISEAASSGISLQSDRRAQNTRRRVHITLELPWSADKAIQQFGRTHRSNQVSAPEYVFLISELAGEKRFASIVAKRLESLGALTHGDRRATETRDLSQFNLDNRYGRDALEVLLKSVTGALNPPLIPPPADYKPGDFFQDMRLYMEGVGLLARQANNTYTIEREAATISKFLNRILGIPVHAQNALFHYFTEIVAELIAQAKLDGTYDMGIMDLGTGGDQVRKLETRVFVGRAEKGGFRVEMQKIGVERGVSWEEAFALFKEHNTDEDGFYVSNSSNTGRQVAVLVYGIGKRRFDNGARLYAVTRPSIGRSPKLITMAEITKRFIKVPPEDAKKLWEDQYAGAIDNCHHTYVHGKCKSEAMGVYCEVGRRTRTYFVLSGSVLSVWPVVEEVLSDRDRRASRMQVIRVRTDQDQKIVGVLVLPHFVRTLVARLEEHCSRCFVEARKEGDGQNSK